MLTTFVVSIVLLTIGMVKVTNSMGDEYSGQVGKAGVFAKWKGRQYRRKYVIPSNPNTTKQQTVRTAFTNGVTAWHTYLTYQRQAYNYMASGQVLSGYNLFLRRYQNAVLAGDPAPSAPVIGWRQVISAQSAVVDETLPAATETLALAGAPVKAGTLTLTPNTCGIAVKAYIELDRGVVRYNVANGHTATLSYEAGGRTIVKEALPNGTGGALEHRMDYWPIDIGTCEFYDNDAVVDGIEIDLTGGNIRLTNTLGGDATGDIDYYSVTAANDCKLEIKKADTSFVAFRGYSDSNGELPGAVTVEDQNYDVVFSKPGFNTDIRSNVAATAAMQDETVLLVAP